MCLWGDLVSLLFASSVRWFGLGSGLGVLAIKASMFATLESSLRTMSTVCSPVGAHRSYRFGVHGQQFSLEPISSTILRRSQVKCDRLFLFEMLEESVSKLTFQRFLALAPEVNKMNSRSTKLVPEV